MTNTYTFALMGLVAHQIQVRVAMKDGAPSFDLAGLPKCAEKETRIRVCSCVMGTAGLSTRIEATLLPEDLPKHGTAYDLPIAMATLGELGKLNSTASKEFIHWVFLGELSIRGDVNGVRGVLPCVLEAKKQGFRGVVVPRENANEAALVDGIEVRAARTLNDVVKFFDGYREALELVQRTNFSPVEKSDGKQLTGIDPTSIDMLKIAAAGRHNLLLVGPPGFGTTLLARSLPFLGPPITEGESIESTALHSVAGLLPEAIPRVKNRPLRAPHHSCSGIGLFGGGDPVQPGEVSLAHNGFLFLENITEFSCNALNQLREPLEENKATVYKNSKYIKFPASFILVATMHPCPCGYHGHPSCECLCTKTQIDRHMGRIPTWMLDHIDLCISVKNDTQKQDQNISAIKSDVSATIKIVSDLRQKDVFLVNSDKFRRALSDYGLSESQTQRTLRLAETICATCGEGSVTREHIEVALSVHPSRYFPLTVGA